MEEYILSEEQINQARSYYFEYICQTADSLAKESKACDEDKYLVVAQMMQERFSPFIENLQKKIRKDLAAGNVSRHLAETMDLGELLRENIAELDIISEVPRV